MFVEHKFYVGLRDINSSKELKNTSLLSYLEDVACMHSEIAGFGITSMDTIKRTWVLLSWKIEVKKRPVYNDFITVKTWSRGVDKFYVFRDFEVRDQNNEIVAIASSKWVFIDIENNKIVKVSDDILEKYKPEYISVFEESNISKLSVRNENTLKSCEYKINKSMIDVNNHLHNIYYMDIAKEVLPPEFAYSNELNNFEIMYKKEVKLGENVKVFYTKEENTHYVTIKSEDEKILHAIIKLK